MRKNINIQEYWDEKYSRTPTPPDILRKYSHHRDLYYQVTAEIFHYIDKVQRRVDILDVGAGPGVIGHCLTFQSLGKYLERMDLYTAVDFSQEAECGFHRHFDKFNEFQEQFLFVRKDLSTSEGLGFISHHKSEVIICCETLEHMEDDLALVAAMKRAVVPSGRIILTTPIKIMVREHLRNYPDKVYQKRISPGFSPGFSEEIKVVKRWRIGIYDCRDSDV